GGEPIHVLGRIDVAIGFAAAQGERRRRQNEIDGIVGQRTQNVEGVGVMAGAEWCFVGGIGHEVPSLFGHSLHMLTCQIILARTSAFGPKRLLMASATAVGTLTSRRSRVSK